MWGDTTEQTLSRIRLSHFVKRVARNGQNGRLDDIGLEVESSEILRRNYHQPYSDFDSDLPTEEADS